MQADRNQKTFVANATPGRVLGNESLTRYLATPLVGAPLTAVEVRGGGSTEVPILADASEGRLFMIVEGTVKVLAGKTYHRVVAGQGIYVPSGVTCEALAETDQFRAFVASFAGVKPGNQAILSLEGMEVSAIGATLAPRFTSLQTGAFEMSEATIESGRYVPLNNEGLEYTAIYVIDGELEMFQYGEAQRLHPGAFVVLPQRERAQIRAIGEKTRVILLHN